MTGIEDIPNELADALARNDALNRAHRAGYLAALEAAKACVPGIKGVSKRALSDYDEGVADGHSDCRETTLTNLTALEQEAKK